MTQPVPVPPATKNCKKCKQPIPLDASLCHFCNSFQSVIASIISRPIEKGSLIISIVVLFLSIIQYLDTKADKTKAEEALEKANKYEIEMKELRDSSRRIAYEVNITKNVVDNISSETKQLILSSLRIQWLLANQSFFALNPNSPQAIKFVNNINTAVDAILKDSAAVKQWWKETAAQNH